MSVRLPLVPSLPNYRFGTALAGTQFLIDVRWNARDEAWYMDVLSEDETLIRGGIKIVLGTLLGGRVVNASFPAGVFVAADLTNSGLDADIDALGDRVVVDFYDFQEF
jgi:hypothetical protein